MSAHCRFAVENGTPTDRHRSPIGDTAVVGAPDEVLNSTAGSFLVHVFVACSPSLHRRRMSPFWALTGSCGASTFILPSHPAILA